MLINQRLGIMREECLREALVNHFLETLRTPLRSVAAKNKDRSKKNCQL